MCLCLSYSDSHKSKASCRLSLCLHMNACTLDTLPVYMLSWCQAMCQPSLCLINVAPVPRGHVVLVFKRNSHHLVVSSSQLPVSQDLDCLVFKASQTSFKPHFKVLIRRNLRTEFKTRETVYCSFAATYIRTRGNCPLQPYETYIQYIHVDVQGIKL